MNKLMSETEKRKMLNLIQQGEAKNTKKILQLSMVKERLKKIMGNEKGQELADCLLELSRSADRLDWLAPTEDRGRQMTQGGSGFAGSVYVDWE
jgi:predicted RecB family endonuclease